MGEKRDAKLFLWSGLFTSIAILGLIKLIFGLHRFFFIGEFVLLLFFGLIALISLAAIYNGLNLGFGFLSFMFGLMLLDLLFIYFKTKPMDLAYLVTIVFSSIGFVMSVVNLGKEGEEEDIVEEFEEPKEVEEEVEESEKTEEVEQSEEVEEAETEEPEKVEEEVEEPEEVEEEPEEEKVFVSGMVVASTAGKLYHSPKCDWVELIKEENRVEYNTKAEAEEDGLNPHTCMEEE